MLEGGPGLPDHVCSSQKMILRQGCLLSGLWLGSVDGFSLVPLLLLSQAVRGQALTEQTVSHTGLSLQAIKSVLTNDLFWAHGDTGLVQPVNI